MGTPPENLVVDVHYADDRWWCLRLRRARWGLWELVEESLDGDRRARLALNPDRAPVERYARALTAKRYARRCAEGPAPGIASLRPLRDEYRVEEGVGVPSPVSILVRPSRG